MNIKMTINEALKIQAEQLDFYCKRLTCRAGQNLRNAVTTRTSIPEELDKDTPLSIFKINEMIPRGGTIENLAGFQDSGGN